jgi:hypothetical protein
MRSFDDQPGHQYCHQKPEQGVSEVLIWDTSAINALGRESDPQHLIARMNNAGIIHRIPMYVFDEIAATQNSTKRTRLLEVCRELKSDSEMIILVSPWNIIEAGVRMYWEVGHVDWEILLGPISAYEEAVESGQVFDDTLAKVQREQNRNNLTRFEDYVEQAKTQFVGSFLAVDGGHKSLDDIVAQARTSGLVQRNARYYCQTILGYPVDSQDLERFSTVFLPMRAMIYAFLFAHYHRDKAPPPVKPAGATDLLASVYLAVGNGLVTDDQDQQKILRDVVRYCSFSTEVVWFSGTLREKYSG